MISGKWKSLSPSIARRPFAMLIFMHCRTGFRAWGLGWLTAIFLQKKGVYQSILRKKRLYIEAPTGVGNILTWKRVLDLLTPISIRG